MVTINSANISHHPIDTELALLTLDVNNESVLKILSGDLGQYLEDSLGSSITHFVMENRAEEFQIYMHERNEEEQLSILMLGISSLYAFIELNWTGPRQLKSSEDKDYLNKIQMEEKIVCEHLSVDSVEFSTIPRQPKLLFLSRFLLSVNYSKLHSSAWWHLRLLHIHQSLLDETSSHLFDRIEALADQLSRTLLSQHPQLKLDFSLEMLHVYLTYGVISKAQAMMKEVTELTDISMELAGALGKRTRWQQKNVAQLLLNIYFNKTENQIKDSANVTNPVSSNSEMSPDTTGTPKPDNDLPQDQHFIESTSKVANTSAMGDKLTTVEKSSVKLPVNVRLDDDTRLETIAYAAGERVPPLTVRQQTIVFANLMHNFRSRPKDELRHEELRPYVDMLLAQDRLPWAVRYGTLYLRSKLEADQRRTVERSMMQLEELRSSLTKSEPSLATRLEDFFTSFIPSANAMETTLAHVFSSLGDIKSALLIHEGLRHYEEMIACYQLLQLRHLAENIIREQLAQSETPKLYCLLGDATDEVEHYHTAWKLSNDRSARAMKCLGLYYFKRQEYATAIPYLQKSLQVNSIQINLWSRLGYAALQCGDQLDVACSAYNRYVSLEPDDFQGWNNLARAYLDRGEKLRAFNALVEAVRTSNMDNWKVIENLMRTALDVGHFEVTLRNYNHLLDIKPKHYDPEVLSILVRAILENLSDAGLKSSARSLLANALRLFGRLTSEIMNESELWFLYAQLNNARDNRSDVTELRKTLKYVIHAHTTRMRDERCTREARMRENLASVCSLLSHVITELATLENPLPDRRQLLLTSKMALRSTLVALERNMEENVEDNSAVSSVKESLERVQQLLS